MSFKYAALISYVGTDYCGWQKQKANAELKAAMSIQETLEKALSRITSEELKVVGSGRTDSGVHALGQVAHFVLQRKAWDVLILQKGLNSLLPTAIRVIDIQAVDIAFHSQRSAIRKQYSYYFQQGSCPLPHLEPYSWWIQKRLNLQAMQSALSHLVGEHDFKPFRAAGAKPGPTVRQILEAEVKFEEISFPNPIPIHAKPFGFVRVRVIGTGFLKQMVRGIAGTLLQVGEGRRHPDCMREIICSGDRKLVGPTAPGRALWLERVWYPEHSVVFCKKID